MQFKHPDIRRTDERIKRSVVGYALSSTLKFFIDKNITYRFVAAEPWTNSSSNFANEMIIEMLHNSKRTSLLQPLNLYILFFIGYCEYHG